MQKNYDIATANTLNIQRFGGASFDCLCHETHRVETELIQFGSGTLSGVGEALSSCVGNYLRVIVISDGTTYEQAGERVQKILSDAGFRADKYVYPKGVNASVDNADLILDAAAEDVRALVGVGAGTIADITKFAAAKLQIPCIIVPTAPSTDGYLSPYSMLSANGVEEVFVIKPPVAAIVDLDIVAAAPPALVAGGYGLVMSKYVTLFDWNFAHIVNGEPYCYGIAELALAALKLTVEAQIGLLRLDKSSIAILAESLLRLSLLQQMSLNSRLANGSEAHVAASISMLKRHNNYASRLHGENAFISAQLLSKLYLMELKQPEDSAPMQPDNVARLEMISYLFGVDEVVAAGKISPLLTPEDYALQRHKYNEYRRDFLEQIEFVERSIALSSKTFRRIYADAGFWTKRYLSEADIKAVLALSCDMRDKYSMLTYLKDIGHLEHFLSDV